MFYNSTLLRLFKSFFNSVICIAMAIKQGTMSHCTLYHRLFSGASPGSDRVEKDLQVRGLASRRDDVEPSVAVQIGGLEIFDRNLVGRDGFHAPVFAVGVEGCVEADTGDAGGSHGAPADQNLIIADPQPPTT